MLPFFDCWIWIYWSSRHFQACPSLWGWGTVQPFVYKDSCPCTSYLNCSLCIWLIKYLFFSFKGILHFAHKPINFLLQEQNPDSSKDRQYLPIFLEPKQITQFLINSNWLPHMLLNFLEVTGAQKHQIFSPYFVNAKECIWLKIITHHLSLTIKSLIDLNTCKPHLAQSLRNGEKVHVVEAKDKKERDSYTTVNIIHALGHVTAAWIHKGLLWELYS